MKQGSGTMTTGPVTAIALGYRGYAVTFTVSQLSLRMTPEARR
jgi:hypothetical protein